VYDGIECVPSTSHYRSGRSLNRLGPGDVEFLDVNIVLHARSTQRLLERAPLLQIPHRGKHAPAA
jgi:hypothetical protein